ncbi:MAG: hypothetical protein RI993_2186 [Pseudomonadota bacterium]|jgi:hypothetical protein
MLSGFDVSAYLTLDKKVFSTFNANMARQNKQLIA